MLLSFLPSHGVPKLSPHSVATEADAVCNDAYRESFYRRQDAQADIHNVASVLTHQCHRVDRYAHAAISAGALRLMQLWWFERDEQLLYSSPTHSALHSAALLVCIRHCYCAMKRVQRLLLTAAMRREPWARFCFARCGSCGRHDGPRRTPTTRGLARSVCSWTHWLRCWSREMPLLCGPRCNPTAAVVRR